MSILCRKICHHQPANSHTTTLEKELLVAILCFAFGFLFSFHREELMHNIEKVFWHWVCDNLTVLIELNLFTAMGLTQKGLDVVLVYISMDSACHLLLKFPFYV